MKLCQIYNIASHYRKRIYTLIDDSFDCTLYTSESSSDIKTMDLSVLKGDVHVVKTVHIGSWSYQSEIINLAFRRFDAFLVTGESRSFSTWIFLFLAKLFGRRVYLWTHGWYGKEKGVYYFANKLMLKLSMGVFLYGNYAKNLLIKEGFDSNRLFVIHNSLDYDDQLILRQSRLESNIYINRFGNDNPVLIFIGRLTPVKQLDLLVDALSMLNGRGVSCNAVFVGAGEEEERLKDLVRFRELENNVWFYGACYDERTNAELIYNADLCVAPGNIGLTAMHVMMFGCPAITHDDFAYQMPEFEAISDGLTGTFFTRGSSASLADNIQQWITSMKDKRETVRENCYREIDEQWNPYFQMKVLRSVLN